MGKPVFAGASPWVAASGEEQDYGLFRTDDDGASWQRFDHGVAMNSTLMTIATSTTSPDRVFCATRRGQVLGTADGGATWSDWHLPQGVEGIYAIACV